VSADPEYVWFLKGDRTKERAFMPIEPPVLVPLTRLDLPTLLVILLGVAFCAGYFVAFGGPHA
jgi:hypothetical protein